MKTLIVFIFVLIIAAVVFIVFSYMEETYLGIILAAIIISWPLVFLLISKIMKKKEKQKEEEKRLKQDIVEDQEKHKELKKHEEKEETIEEAKEEELVVPQKKDINLNKTKEELKKLKKAAEVLGEEKKEGILSEETYNELKKQNDETIEKLEQEIAKASGEIREKKAYCKKGDHYINLNICLPSKVKGYVICPEHNEEIRVE